MSASSSRSGVSGISAGRGSSAATSAGLLQLSAGLAWNRSAIFFKISQIVWNCFQNLEWLGQNTQPPCRAIISNCNSARGSTRTSRSTRTTSTRTSELPLRTLNNSLSEKNYPTQGIWQRRPCVEGEVSQHWNARRHRCGSTSDGKIQSGREQLQLGRR